MNARALFSRILLSLIAGLFVPFFSCAAGEEDDRGDAVAKQKMVIVGYGIGDSPSPRMAEIKARSAALRNLAEQLCGKDFEVLVSEESVSIRTSQEATVKGAVVVSVTRLSGSRVLVIQKTEQEVDVVAGGGVVFREASGTSADVAEILHEMCSRSLREEIALRFPEATRVTGKVYLSGLKVSESDDQGRFTVSAKFAIVFREIG